MFVVGSPRSGTTFVGDSLGALPGFVDLGEVTRSRPRFPSSPRSRAEAAPRLRGILERVRRLALVACAAWSRRPRPPTCLRGAAGVSARRAVHVVRDGRDVVCSLLERGWLARARGRGRRGARLRRARPLLGGAGAERGVRAGERGDPRGLGLAALRIRRAVAARPNRGGALRGGRLEPGGRRLPPRERAPHRSGASRACLRRRACALGRALAEDLTSEQVADVEQEAGDLLRELGYL